MQIVIWQGALSELTRTFVSVYSVWVSQVLSLVGTELTQKAAGSCMLLSALISLPSALFLRLSGCVLARCDDVDGVGGGGAGIDLASSVDLPRGQDMI